MADINKNEKKIMNDLVEKEQEWKIKREEQIYEFKGMLNMIDEDTIKNLSDQVINYAFNETDGNINVFNMFTNCTMVMKDIFDEEKENIRNKDIEFQNKKRTLNMAFCKSLDESGDCISMPIEYKKNIDQLQAGRDDSFILAPILTTNHVFSVAIYRRKDGNYDFIAINKGGRTFDLGAGVKKHHPFERYTIEPDNVKNIIPILDVGSHAATKSTAEIYKILSDNAIEKEYEELKDIDARGQRVGNCYYKEVEEGLKYVYYRLYKNYEKNEIEYIEDYNSDVLNKFEYNTPKLPGGTKEFHIRVLENIRKYSDNPNVKEYVSNLIVTYTKNKTFRDKMKEKSSMTQQEKENIFKEIFGDDTINLKDEMSLKRCLKNVDERTLQENTELFVNMLKEAKITVPTIMMSAEIVATDFIGASKKYFMQANNREKLNELENVFPDVAKRIRKTVDYLEFERVVKQKEMAVDDLKKLLELNLCDYHKTTVYDILAKDKEKKGDIDGALELYDEALKLVDKKAPLRTEYLNNRIKTIKDKIKREKGPMLKLKIPALTQKVEEKMEIKKVPQLKIPSPENIKKKKVLEEPIEEIPVTKEIKKVPQLKIPSPENLKKKKTLEEPIKKAPISEEISNTPVLKVPNVANIKKKIQEKNEKKKIRIVNIGELKDGVLELRANGKSSMALEVLNRLLEDKENENNIYIREQRLECLKDMPDKKKEALDEATHILNIVSEKGINDDETTDNVHEIRAELLESFGRKEEAIREYRYMLGQFENNRKYREKVKLLSREIERESKKQPGSNIVIKDTKKEKDMEI